MGWLRSALVLWYVALAAGAVWWMHEASTRIDGLLIFLFYVAAVVVLVLIVLAYLFSLLIAGIMYRRGAPVWAAGLLGIVLGPVVVAAMMWIFGAVT